jgi:predicted nucleic acid-binding protein
MIVADSNALIGLAKGKVFHLLGEFFGLVWIPQTVWDEVVVQGAGRPGAAEAQAASRTWLKVETVAPSSLTFPSGLDAADRDMVALAQQLGIQHILTGDRAARIFAQQLGLHVHYAVEVVAAAKRMGLISSARQVMDDMLAAGFGIEDSLYDLMLRLAQE